MKHSDLHLVVLGTSLQFGFFAMVWGLVWFRVVAERRVAWHWVAGSLCGLMGAMLIGARGEAPNFWTHVFANHCVMAYVGFFARGTETFMRQPSRDREKLLAFALAAGAFIFVGYRAEQSAARVLIVSLYFAWTGLHHVVRVAGVIAKEFGRMISTLSMFPWVLLASISLVRAVLAVTRPELTTDVEKRNELNLIVIYGEVLVSMSLTFMALLQWGLRLKERLSAEARTDGLTGLLNRRGFMPVLGQAWSRAQLQGTSFSVVCLDVDHFKRINDTHGHATGDLVLRQVARRLTTTLGPEGICARIGGEEFCVVVKGGGLDDAALLAERLRLQFLTAQPQLPAEVLVTVSAGVAEVEAGDDSAEAVMQRADRALYRAKRGGRNRVVAFRRDGPEQDWPATLAASLAMPASESA